MIRKNKKIKGISINEKEYKLSQYADDTQFILDSTEKSLKISLNWLEQFYTIPVLKNRCWQNKGIMDWLVMWLSWNSVWGIYIRLVKGPIKYFRSHIFSPHLILHYLGL